MAQSAMATALTRSPEEPAHPGERPSQLVEGGPNAIAVTLGLVGDEWTLLIVRLALVGARRYRDFLDAMPISNSVLTMRLNRLVEMGVLERVEYSDRPLRHDYRLTRRGRDLWTILLAMWAWELEWVPDRATPLPRMVHRRCQTAFLPVMVCGGCREPVRPRDISGGFGASGTFERSVPAATTRRRSGPPGGDQSILFPQTMALIGNRWSAAVLGAAFQGARRFGEFETRLGAPPTMVADRLRTFRELGIFDVVPSPERADALAYRLSDKGRAFFPVVMLTIEWGHRWFKAPEGRALVYRHRGCGRPFRPQLVCGVCSEPLRGREVELDTSMAQDDARAPSRG